MPTKILIADSAADLRAQIEAQAADGFLPAGAVSLIPAGELVNYDLSIPMVDAGGDVEVIRASSVADLEEKITAAVADGKSPAGAAMFVPAGQDVNYRIVATVSDSAGGDAPEAVTWATLTGKPATFPPTIGTTATTAKAGNYAPTWDQVTSKPATFPPVVGTGATDAKPGNYVPAWGDVTGKPTTFAPAAHAATLVNVAADATNGIAAGNAQVVLSALAARVQALEDAAPAG